MLRFLVRVVGVRVLGFRKHCPWRSPEFDATLTTGSPQTGNPWLLLLNRWHYNATLLCRAVGCSESRRPAISPSVRSRRAGKSPFSGGRLEASVPGACSRTRCAPGQILTAPSGRRGADGDRRGSARRFWRNGNSVKAADPPLPRKQPQKPQTAGTDSGLADSTELCPLGPPLFSFSVGARTGMWDCPLDSAGVSPFAPRPSISMARCCAHESTMCCKSTAYSGPVCLVLASDHFWQARCDT